MLDKVAFNRGILLIFLVINSGCFFLSDDKKSGLPFLREIFLIIVIAYSIYILIVWKKAYSYKTSLWILVMATVLPGVSALFAKLNFGQPFLYGLLEERRFFMYLIFFPMFYLLKKACVSEDQVSRMFLASGIICAVIGFLYYFHVIPENTSVAFHIDESGGIDELRPNRFRIGENYITICVFMLMYRLRKSISLPDLSVLLFFAAYLWFVTQTRQVMLIWALAGLWIFMGNPAALIKIVALVLAPIALIGIMTPSLTEDILGRFNELFFAAANEPSVRDKTILTIINAIYNNNYIGMGALSLQWGGGFSTIYGENFYLADVGIFGVYYRYGFFAIFVLLFFYVGFSKTLFKCRQKGPLLKALQLVFLTMCLNFALSNALTFAGETLGMAAALFLYFSYFNSATNHTYEPRRIGFDKFQHCHD